MRKFRINFVNKSNVRQLLAAVVANLGTMSTAMAMGWASPTIPLLLEEDTPVGTEPMTSDEISWLSSIPVLMPLIVLPITAWTLERFGRKKTGWAIAFPLIINWLITYFAQNFWQLLIARILSGVSLALMCAVVPVYVTEIADQSMRGPLGSLYAFSINVGVLIALIFGVILTYHQFAVGAIILPVIFLVAFWFMPETPVYLIRKARIPEATKSLMWLTNNDTVAVDRELSELQQRLEDMVEPDKLVNIKDLFRDRATITAFIIASGLFIGQHTSGYTIVVTYTSLIFGLAKSSLTPNISAIVLAVIQIGGSWLSTMTINLTGRRYIIIISCVGMMISHIFFGTFFLLMDQNVDVSSFAWLPLVVLSAYAVFYSMGLGPAAYIVAAEIFSPDVASLGASTSMMLLWLASFITVKLFPLISENYGNFTSFYILAGFCACTGIFTFILVPETKGKSNQVIIDELNGKKKQNFGYPEAGDNNSEKF
ncbi:facilitated trehalose transporter Tret1-like [Diachasmimorpha longicaudata]|uniref:facilitated trehalose transporter Tret1-like n=1 Tax=Diachasmimorpha longicaudata TaxID=58733 RepID=UPI0030B8BA94